jgi:hypothetical protein
VRGGKYKYVYYSQLPSDFPIQRELYDPEADPDEFVNLVSFGAPEKDGRVSHTDD